MNKARHDLEIKLEDENKRNTNLIEQLNMRDEALDKRQVEINDLEKQVQELTRQNGDIEIKYLPAIEMIADLLTKPITGALFEKLSNRLRGGTKEEVGEMKHKNTHEKEAQKKGDTGKRHVVNKDLEHSIT